MRKKLFRPAASVGAFILFSVLLKGQSNLNINQLESLLASDKTVQVVDVRTPGEIQQTGKIAGAWEINYAAPDFAEKIRHLDRKRPVVLYCASGGRSTRAAAQLVQMGFAKVYNYTGGMYEWKALRKPTVPAGDKTKP